MSASLSATIRDGASGKSSPSSLGKGPGFNWADVNVRPFAAQDIEPWLRYLYHSPRDNGFLQQLDLARLPNEVEYGEQLRHILGQFSRAPWMSVEVKGELVGVHLLMDYVNGAGNFQAHLWPVGVRGRGLGLISWLKACTYLFEVLEPLHTIYFKFPSNDSMVKRFAAKLPLNRLREEPLHGLFFREGQMGSVYKLDRIEFESLNQRSNDQDLDADD